MRKTIFITLNIIALVLTTIWFFCDYEWEPAAGITLCLANLFDNIVVKRREKFIFNNDQLQMKKLLERIRAEMSGA